MSLLCSAHAIIVVCTICWFEFFCKCFKYVWCMVHFLLFTGCNRLSILLYSVLLYSAGTTEVSSETTEISSETTEISSETTEISVVSHPKPLKFQWFRSSKTAKKTLGHSRFQLFLLFPHPRRALHIRRVLKLESQCSEITERPARET